MIVAARVAEQATSDVFAGWFADNWVQDAMELSEMYVQDGQHAVALSTLKAVRDAADKHNLQKLPEVDDRIAGLEFLQALAKARAQYEEEVKQPGDHPQAHVFLGILNLLQDGDKKAGLKHLRDSKQSEAVEFGAKVESYGKSPQDPQAALAAARAAVVLADNTKETYLRLLLQKDVLEKLAVCLDSPRLGEANRLRAEMLKEKVARQSEKLLKQLPKMAQLRFLRRARKTDVSDTEALDFFGVGGVASKIVFVVDRSGSMTDSIMYVKHELKRSIGALKPNQEFFVIFYSSGPPQMMPVRRLLPATEANKQTSYKFIDNIVPIGQTDPDEALSEAFKLKPKLIYLLTDGEFDKKTVGHISRLNRRKRVAVNTICFIYSNGQAILKEIANKNNGTYKYVGEDDLQSLGWTKPSRRRPRSMPKKEQQNLARWVYYLEVNRICQACHGTGRVGSGVCIYCSARGFRDGKIRGNGRTPISKLRPIVNLIQGHIAKYGALVPLALRARARSALASIGQ